MQKRLMILLACVACGSPTAPVHIDFTDRDVAPIANAQQFPLPPEYATYWANAEACAGRTGHLSDLTFYQVVGAAVLDVTTLTDEVTSAASAYGYWTRRGNRVVLAGNKLGDPKLVTHEMVHALLQRGDHPKRYFADCGLAY